MKVRLHASIIFLAISWCSAAREIYQYRQNEGKPVSLTYTFRTAAEHCRFKLYHENDLLNDNGTPRVSHRKDSRLQVYTSDLHESLSVTVRINNLKATDAGRYTCACNLP